MSQPEPGSPEFAPSLDTSRLFLSYLQDAARLRLEISPFQADVEFEATGGSIIYAVDANIILLFTSPDAKGPFVSSGGGGYGVVFHDDEEAASTTLATALSRFIFWRLSAKRHPLALLIGHAAETRAIFNDLSGRVDRDFGKIADEKQKLQEIVTLLATETDRGARLSFLQKHVPTLLQYLFYEKGADAEMRRFAQLLTEGRVQRLTSLIHQPRFFSDEPQRDAELRKTFLIPSSLQDQIEESRYKIDWLERIWTASRARAENTGRADATALARLELLNRRAARKNCRVVLVTGDQLMFRIAGEYFPFGADKGSFASLFLRHPRAFVSAPEVLTPSGSSVERGERRAPQLIIGWLDTLLARYTTDDGVAADQLRDLIDHGGKLRGRALKEVAAALRLDPKAPTNIRDQWREHVRGLEGAHSVTSELVRPELLGLLEGRDTTAIEEGLQRLSLEVARRTEQTWEVFVGAVARAGFDLTLVEINPAMGRRRNAPPILFDSFEEASRFCQLVFSADGFANIKPEEFRQKLTSLDREDPTGYAQLLAYGVLFAHAGKWHVAAVLASRAIALAEEITTGAAAGRQDQSAAAKAARAVISGREAYYLRAVSLRFKARHTAELNGIEALLDKAESAYHRDKERNPGLSETSFRFASERLSLRLNRCLMGVFSGGNSDSEREQSISEVRELIMEFDRLASRLDLAERSWVQRVVERNVLTNIFMLHAVVEAERGSSRDLDELVGKRIDAYLRNIGAHDLKDAGFPITWLVSAVSWHAIGRFGKPDRRTRAKLKDDIARLEHLLREEPEAIVVAPYDRKRFVFLIATGKRELGAG